MKKQDLLPSEYKGYFDRYINKVDDNTELISGYQADKKMVVDFFSSIPKDKLNYRYQPKKWSIKEVLQHLIDTERIFMYRVLRIARQDDTPLIGYDQDTYIKPSNADSKSIEDLLQEFIVTRDYAINLLKSLSDENLRNIGAASDTQLSARACAFTMLGHSIWHIEIIKERYL